MFFMPNLVNFQMASAIARYESIDQLEQLNATPIAEIERRARPGVYATTGFLGPEESLKEVMKADWQTVQHLGTTHRELAHQIKSLWEKSPLTLYQNNLEKNPIRATETISFKLAALVSIITLSAAIVFTNLFVLLWGLALAVPLAVLALRKTQILFIFQVAHRGTQQDIFEKEGRMYENVWNSQLTVVNLLNFERVTIGRGVIDYIEKYGFYEGGGEQNSYRVDPARLVSILSGASVATVRSKRV